MKKTFYIVAVLAIHSICSIAQSTDSLLSPRVWLRSDLSTLNANRWTDVSVFKNDAYASSVKETPQLTGVVNYNKAIVFDGLDDYFIIPYSLEGLSDLSILAVYQSVDTTERGIWGSEQGSSRNVLLTTRRAIGPDTITDIFGKTEKQTILNSVLQNWEKATAATANAYFALGSAGKTKGYKAFKGSLAEILIFNRSLSFLERAQYETYLAIKYGTGLHAGNFVSSGEKVLWRADANKNYSNSISGLGRDDVFKLYQKQTGSAYDSGLLIMSTGKLAESNESNKTSLNDQDFLLWGSNGMSMHVKRGVGPDSTLAISERKWLITATGNTANRLPVELYIDAAKLPSNSLGYWLVIDRSGQGNFSVDNLEYVEADRIENGKVIYKNILWDTDGSGKDCFGFAQARSLFAVVRTVKDPSCADKAAGKIRVEMISGKGPFQYILSNKPANISRSWKETQSSSDQKELVAGNYALSILDDSGLKLVRNFSLQEPDALQISLGHDQKIVEGQEIILDVSSQVPDSIKVDYKWESNFALSSSDSKINVTESGIYRVSVTKEIDGCVFSDEIVISGSEQRIAVYPSILKTYENFNTSVSLEEPGSVTVKVISSNGLLVNSMTGTGNSEYQFISTLKDSGMYMVVIQTPKGIETKKVVIY